MPSNVALPPPELRRALRVAAGLSLAEIGEVCGVTRQCVSLWELGSRTPAPPHSGAYLTLLHDLAEHFTGLPR